MTPHLRDRVLFRDADGVERAGVVIGIGGYYGKMCYDVWRESDRRRVVGLPASAIVSVMARRSPEFLSSGDGRR